jgi:hypothetical protein
VKLRVVRATWWVPRANVAKSALTASARSPRFYSSSRDGGYAPIAWDEPLARDLDAAYAAARPWLRKAAAEEDSKEILEGEKSEEELADKLCELPSMDAGGSVHFDSPCSGRILT